MFSLFLHLCLASLAMAAPVANDQVHVMSPAQYGAGGGVIGFIVLVLDIIVWSESSLTFCACGQN